MKLTNPCGGENRVTGKTCIALLSFMSKQRHCPSDCPSIRTTHITIHRVPSSSSLSFVPSIVLVAYQSNYSQTLSGIARVTFRAGNPVDRVASGCVASPHSTVIPTSIAYLDALRRRMHTSSLFRRRNYEVQTDRTEYQSFSYFD